MENYKEMTFDEIIDTVRAELEPASVYAKHDTLEIFAIRSSDDFGDWYHFYCLRYPSREPVCFSAVTTDKQAKRLFKALTEV